MKLGKLKPKDSQEYLFIPFGCKINSLIKEKGLDSVAKMSEVFLLQNYDISVLWKAELLKCPPKMV